MSRCDSTHPLITENGINVVSTTRNCFFGGERCWFSLGRHQTAPTHQRPPPVNLRLKSRTHWSADHKNRVTGKLPSLRESVLSTISHNQILHEPEILIHVILGGATGGMA